MYLWYGVNCVGVVVVVVIVVGGDCWWVKLLVVGSVGIIGVVAGVVDFVVYCVGGRCIVCSVDYDVVME